MDISKITDKKELAYLIITEQRTFDVTQGNLKALYARINEVEKAEQAAAKKEKKTSKQEAFFISLYGLSAIHHRSYIHSTPSRAPCHV